MLNVQEVFLLPQPAMDGNVSSWQVDLQALSAAALKLPRYQPW